MKIFQSIPPTSVTVYLFNHSQKNRLMSSIVCTYDYWSVENQIRGDNESESDNYEISLQQYCTMIHTT